MNNNDGFYGAMTVMFTLFAWASMSAFSNATHFISATLSLVIAFVFAILALLCIAKLR